MELTGSYVTISYWEDLPHLLCRADDDIDEDASLFKQLCEYNNTLLRRITPSVPRLIIFQEYRIIFVKLIQNN